MIEYLNKKGAAYRQVQAAQGSRGIPPLVEFNISESEEYGHGQ